MDNGILGPMRVRDMTHSMYILPILLAVRLNDSTVDADNCLKSCYRYDRCTGSHHMQRLPWRKSTPEPEAKLPPLSTIKNHL